jgi:hypothetical protein
MVSPFAAPDMAYANVHWVSTGQDPLDAPPDAFAYLVAAYTGDEQHRINRVNKANLIDFITVLLS